MLGRRVRPKLKAKATIPSNYFSHLTVCGASQQHLNHCCVIGHNCNLAIMVFAECTWPQKCVNKLAPPILRTFWHERTTRQRNGAFYTVLYIETLDEQLD